MPQGKCADFEGVLVEASQYVGYARGLKECEETELANMELNFEKGQLEREVERLKDGQTGFGKWNYLIIGLLIGYAFSGHQQGQ